MTKILVIEDEAGIRDELIDWLAFEGFVVLGAENGRLGLAAALHERPDLIVCDIAMPEMDGHEVLIEVRANPALNLTPFVFLTASADRDSVRKGMNLGADDYLTKPFTHAEVLNTIRSRLEKKTLQETQYNAYIDMLSSALSQEREKHVLKTRLVAMFSHDFRNPLTSVLASSDILRHYDDRLTPERKHQHLDRIDGAVRMLIQMLDEMLIVAELELGRVDYTPVPVETAHLLGSIVEEFRLIDQGDHLLSIANTVMCSVMAEPRLLRQIVTNLISNAIKYSPSGTAITITLRQDQDELVLMVQDQGIGIPEESLPHLFEPFHRAANAKGVKGTGLGLNIVRECVDRHQGTIGVESRLGSGTTVTVRIPFIPA